jgi:hypothetical protein
MISVLELHELFDVGIDKYGSPYFLDKEKDAFINEAQINIIKDLVYNRRRDVNLNGRLDVGYEANESISAQIQPFVRTASGTMSTPGLIDDAALKLAYGREYVKVISVELVMDDGNWVMAQWARTNDIPKFAISSMKSPQRGCRMYYTLEYEGIFVHPGNVAEDYRVKSIVMPAKVNSTTLVPVDSEFPESMKHELVSRAVALAALSIRDQGLYGAQNSENNNQQL